MTATAGRQASGKKNGLSCPAHGAGTFEHPQSSTHANTYVHSDQVRREYIIITITVLWQLSEDKFQLLEVESKSPFIQI